MTTTLGLTIAFLSGLAWAGLDVARKALTVRYGAVVIAAGLSLGAAMLFASGALFTSPQMELGSYLVPGLISTTLGISTQLLILESVRRSPLSRTIPMLSFTPVATSLFGVAVLGEQPSASEWIGIVLVFVGALVLGMSRKAAPAATAAGRRAFDGGAALMLLAAVSISAAAPFDKLAVEASTTLVHGLVQSLGAAVVLLGLLTARGDLMELRAVFRSQPVMAGAVVLAAVAIALQYLAYRGAMVGEVETIKRVVGSIASLGTGFWVFAEAITLTKVAAVAALGVGVALILLAAT